MRKVAFALVHCFQTCLISLACCSMCLILCLLTKIAQNLSNRSKITLKLLAVCETGLHFRATSFGLARNHFCLARNLLVSCEIISVSCEIKLWCRISRELETSSRGLKSVSREVKLLRATWKVSSCEILCQHLPFWSVFAVLRPAHCLFFEFVFVPCLRTILNNDTLRTWGDGNPP